MVIELEKCSGPAAFETAELMNVRNINILTKATSQAFKESYTTPGDIMRAAPFLRYAKDAAGLYPRSLKKLLKNDPTTHINKCLT